MNLLFCIDQNFAPLLLQCLDSIQKNGGEEHYDAYLLHSDLPEPLQRSLAQRVGPAVTLHFIPVPEEVFEGFPVSRRYPRQIYYRIAAPLLLPHQLERILYLDVDTIILRPLGALYRREFRGAYFLACTHTRRLLTKLNQARLGLEPDGQIPYINTGVMLLNLPQLRQRLDLAEIQRYVQEHKMTLLLPDQDIVTALYGGNVRILDTMYYNLSDRMFLLEQAAQAALGHRRRDLDWVRRHSVILHFCGRMKPWKPDYIGPLGAFYREQYPEGLAPFQLG